ncbi:hypothetical protein D3C78_1792820 [compost metagenome]
MHGRGYTCSLEVFLHPITRLYLHRVLRPGAAVVVVDKGRGDAGLTEQVRVTLGDLLAQLQLTREYLQLG